MKWVEKKLSSLPPSKRENILAQIKSYLKEAQWKQNISYHNLIRSLGNKIQFINGFLIKIGAQPLPLRRSWLHIFFTLFLSLFLFGFIISASLYYYIDSQFNFDFKNGDIKFFGKKVDVNHTSISSINQFHKQYIQKSTYLNPQTPIQIKLAQTRTTITHHSQKTNLFTISCEIDHQQKLSLTQQKKSLLVNVPGESNCDLTLPPTIIFQVYFKTGQLTIDQPTTSFKIKGDAGRVNWIKHPTVKFNISYDVQTVNIQGVTEDIFEQSSPHNVHIQLENGSLSFLDPL